MSASPADFKKSGDFYLQSNPTLTQEIMARELKRVDVQDFIRMCLLWYQRPPLKIPEECTVISSSGKHDLLRLSQITLEGSW